MTQQQLEDLDMDLLMGRIDHLSIEYNYSDGEIRQRIVNELICTQEALLKKMCERLL